MPVPDNTPMPSTPEDQDREAWTLAVDVLKRAGTAEKQARSFFAKLLKEYGLSPRDLLSALNTADSIGTLYPAAYLTAAAMRISRGRQDPGLACDWT